MLEGRKVEATECQSKAQEKGQRASGKERKERGPEDPAERKAESQTSGPKARRGTEAAEAVPTISGQTRTMPDRPPHDALPA